MTISNGPIWKPKLLILDVDGVQTDGRLFYSSLGESSKVFNVRDGVGIHKALSAGLNVAFLSAGRAESAVTRRAKDLGVTLVAVGVRDKVDVASRWLNLLGIEWRDVAVVVDDVPDIPLVEMAGWSSCPSNADWRVKARVDLILVTPGGEGCVREAVEVLLDHESAIERKVEQ